MSYDRRAAPGIWTAVRHFVSVLVGAPEPWHGGAASAVPEVASNPAPSSAEAARVAASRVREENLASIFASIFASFSECCLPIGRLDVRFIVEGMYADARVIAPLRIVQADCHPSGARARLAKRSITSDRPLT